MLKVVILLPTYNEAQNIELLLLDIFFHTKKIKDWRIEVLVIDSQSHDGTQQIVKNFQKKYPNLHLLQVKKEGLGKAYMRGYKYALEHFSPSTFIQMDADLSHEPKEILHFLRSISDGADLVIGSRYIEGGSIPNDWAMHRKIFSKIGNYIIRIGIFDLAITDWTTGYRAINASFIKNLPKSIEQYTGYIFMIAVLNHIRLQKAVIQEIPIKFQNRHGGKSKLPAHKYIVDVLQYVAMHSPLVKIFR